LASEARYWSSDYRRVRTGHQMWQYTMETGVGHGRGATLKVDNET
jgi:hypothetical protein